jgi:hypothetical protein
MTPRQVVAQNPLPRFGRIIMNRLPKRIGCDLLGFPILGHHVDDPNADGAQLVKEFRGLRNHRTAALNSQRKRRHRRIQMSAMHVDGYDRCGMSLKPHVFSMFAVSKSSPTENLAVHRRSRRLAFERARHFFGSLGLKFDHGFA